jgi:D-alanyl-lipoteichoic acid acyltransferase DltB (MBOAT superfamily)
MKNFNRPYFADSVADFWRRWHISLSTWFKDYLYFPLGGNRVAKGRWAFNVMVVFLVSGLWHGAAWTYVIWGALHGAYLVAEDLTAGARARIAEVTGLARFPRLRKGLAVLATFHLVLFAWIFFRARTLSDAWLILKTIASGAGFGRGAAALGLTAPILALCLGLIVLLETVHVLQERGVGARMLGNTPVTVRWGLYLLLLMGVLNLRPAEVAPFIYFQF